MAKLHIALQAGFVGDTVSIHIDGREVFSQSGVTNRDHSGPAGTVDVNVPAGRKK